MSEFYQMRNNGRDIFVTGKKWVADSLPPRIVKFDPLTNKEEIIGVLDHPGYSFNTSLGCVGDRLFLVGGNNNGPTNRVSSFNVVTRRPQPVRPMNTPRARCAVSSSRQELIVCGGLENFASDVDYKLNSCEVLHVSRNTWQRMPHLQQGRYSFRVVWLPTGQIVVMGGHDALKYLNSVELLIRRWDGGNAADDCWRFVAPMLTPKVDFGAVYYLETIIIAGGFNGQYLKSAEIFAPVNELGQWTKMKPINTSLGGCCGVVSSKVVFMLDEFCHRKTQRLTRMDDEDPHNWIWDEILPLKSVQFPTMSTSFV